MNGLARMLEVNEEDVVKGQALMLAEILRHIPGVEDVVVAPRVSRKTEVVYDLVRYTRDDKRFVIRIREE